MHKGFLEHVTRGKETTPPKVTNQHSKTVRDRKPGKKGTTFCTGKSKIVKNDNMFKFYFSVRVTGKLSVFEWAVAPSHRDTTF